jgi:hypothetical protein
LPDDAELQPDDIRRENDFALQTPFFRMIFAFWLLKFPTLRG